MRFLTLASLNLRITEESDGSLSDLVLLVTSQPSKILKHLPLVLCFQIEQVTYTRSQTWMPYTPAPEDNSKHIFYELESDTKKVKNIRKNYGWRQIINN
jgi:hypothetical protein